MAFLYFPVKFLFHFDWCSTVVQYYFNSSRKGQLHHLGEDSLGRLHEARLHPREREALLAALAVGEDVQGRIRRVSARQPHRLF